MQYLGKKRSRGTSGNDSKEVVPAAFNTTSVLFDELLENCGYSKNSRVLTYSHGNGHSLLNSAGSVDISRNVEKLGSGVSLSSKGGEPIGASSANCRSDSDCLDVVDGRWAAEGADGSWEWWLQSGLSLKTKSQSRDNIIKLNIKEAKKTTFSSVPVCPREIQ